MSNVPGDLSYTDAHVWVERHADGRYKVGITDFAQEELGDIVFVELPEIGKSFASGDECAVVESVKSTSDIFCPLSGEISEVNDELNDSPELINSDCYGDGWIFMITPDDNNNLDDLLDADSYSGIIEE